MDEISELQARIQNARNYTYKAEKAVHTSKKIHFATVQKCGNASEEARISYANWGNAVNEHAKAVQQVALLEKRLDSLWRAAAQSREES